MHTTLNALSHLAVAAAMQPLAAPKTLPQVIDGITGWIMSIIAVVATMFLAVASLRYMSAAGDPAQVEQAKGNFKSALIGYALAILTPVILQVLQGILGVRR
jgi:heme/copper-type cytochrome/quinol oxidase subunit 2